MSINVKDTVYVFSHSHICQFAANLLFAYSKAISEMVLIIDPEHDYLTIAAAEEQMELTNEARQKELSDAHSKLRREFPRYQDSL